MLSSPEHPGCERALATTLSLCVELGFPVVSERTEGPTTSLTFLGIEFDMVQEQIHLPQEKLARLLAAIASWSKTTDPLVPQGAGRKRDLLSLIGLLNHAASVVRPGRPFLHSLIDAAATAKGLDHWIHLNHTTQVDLA